MKALCYLVLALGVTLAAGDSSSSSSESSSSSSSSSEEDKSCRCGWINQGRIVGGDRVPKNKYPMVAALMLEGTRHCGGTILTPWHVLTAAHCGMNIGPYNIKSFKIRVGSHDLNITDDTSYDVDRVIMHEMFDYDRSINDIAIVVLKKPIKYTQKVGPACLPSRRLSLVGQKLKALGWGYIDDNMSTDSILREVDLGVIPYDQCAAAWRGNRFVVRRETNTCTYEERKSTCAYDSGGPLLWLNPATKRYTIAALVSYGAECGGQLPNVHTDVSSYLPWIQRTIAGTKKRVSPCTKG